MFRIKQYHRNKATKHARNRPENTESFFQRLKDPINFFTAVLALVTLALVVVGILQWRTLEKTDHTIRSGQRAFVFIKSNNAAWTAAKQVGNDTIRGFAVIWENSGNSQTKNLRVSLYCPKPEWYSVETPLEKYKPVIYKQRRLLGPKQTVWGGVCNYKDAELESVRADKKHLYVAAVAQYFDIYDEPHVTKYCAEIINLVGDFKSLQVVPQSDLASCAGNCADDECEE